MSRTFFDLPQTRFASVLSTGLGAHGLAESAGISNKSLRMLLKIILEVKGGEMMLRNVVLNYNSRLL